MNNLEHYTVWTALSGFCVPLIIASVKRGLILPSLLWTVLLICDLTLGYKFYTKIQSEGLNRE